MKSQSQCIMIRLLESDHDLFLCLSVIFSEKPGSHFFRIMLDGHIQP